MLLVFSFQFLETILIHCVNLISYSSGIGDTR